MKYSIIVALDNKFALVNNFVENLLNTTDIEHEGEVVIVLDGCSDINSINYLKTLEKDKTFIKIIENSNRKGYGIANNIAVDNSSGDNLVFLNSDVFPTRGSVLKLVNYLVQNRESVGAVQGLLIYPQNNKVQSTGHLFIDLQNTHVYQGKSIDDIIISKEDVRQALTTAFCAIPRDLFYKNGRFNEYYYNAYEGFELTLKISLTGLQCMYYPQAVAYHISGGSRSKMNISESQQSKYFIHNWGKYIVNDIARYISPQISHNFLDKIYTIINLSQLKGWNETLDLLGFNTNGVIESPCTGEINLYETFPYSFLNYNGNYLFIIDSMNNLSRNYNWIKNRLNSEDIIIDSHGNFILMKDLII